MTNLCTFWFTFDMTTISGFAKQTISKSKILTELLRRGAKQSPHKTQLATLLVSIAIFSPLSTASVVPSPALTHPAPHPPPPAPMEAVAMPMSMSRSAAVCRPAAALLASRTTARPLSHGALTAASGRRLVARRVAAAGDKVETDQEAVPIEKSRSIFFSSRASSLRA